MVALLLARYRRLDLVEDALGDAVEAATRRWPQDGPPDNPAGWLYTAAGRRVVDRLRTEAMHRRRVPLLVTEAQHASQSTQVMADPGGLVEDDVLRLVLMCTHPAIAPDAASALALRLVMGVSTHDIARLFLVPEATMAARLTRAKKKIVAAGVPFAVPDASLIPERLEGAADIAYLAFTSGYAPGSGADLQRPELAGEAIRLVRVMRQHAPSEPILRALLALMLLHHSRRDARLDAGGEITLLRDQDRSRWHRDEIGEAVALLRGFTAPAEMSSGVASYLIQAQIAAENSTAPSSEATRWDRLVAYYDLLLQVASSPAARLARAVAVAEASGPDAGLSALEGLSMPGSHRLAAVRAELLTRTGDGQGAALAYREAIELCRNEVELAYLRKRAATLS